MTLSKLDFATLLQGHELPANKRVIVGICVGGDETSSPIDLKSQKKFNLNAPLYSDLLRHSKLRQNHKTHSIIIHIHGVIEFYFMQHVINIQCKWFFHKFIEEKIVLNTCVLHVNCLVLESYVI